MPSRILRDWTDSDRFDGLTAEAERMFVRLLMKVDDYGRFHAEPRRLKAALFPLLDTIRANDLDRWLIELSHRQLILRYEVENRQLLAIPRFGQRLKQSVPKFPPAPGMPNDWLPDAGAFTPIPADKRLPSECIQEIPGSSGNCLEASLLFPPDADAEANTEAKAKEKKRAGKPALTSLPDGFGISERVRVWAAEKGHTQLEARLEHFTSYAKRSGKRYADWDEALMGAIREDWAKLSGRAGYQPAVPKTGFGQQDYLVDTRGNTIEKAA